MTINGDPRRLSRRSKDELSLMVLLTEPVADPDLELRGRGEEAFCFACPAGFFSFCDFFSVYPK